MNKNGKLFGKISIIDIIVVVCIVVLAFGIYAKFTSSSDAVSSSERANIEFVYKVKSVRDYTVKGFEKGGSFYDSDTKEYMGEVVGVTAEPAIMDVNLVDGTYKNVEVPDKFDAYVTVRVNGKYNSLGYYTTDNKYIGAGSTLNAWSKFTNTGGEIVAVHEVTE